LDAFGLNFVKGIARCLASFGEVTVVSRLSEPSVLM
jgi:hypothetical protein